MIRFADVALRYRLGAEVLSGLDFDVPAGGFRWLTGASGAGKTSLLRLMYLAERPSRGEINILGSNISRLGRRQTALLRRRIGVVYQDFRLLGHLSAYDNVALPMRLARAGEAQVRADVTELLRWVGLYGQLERRADELSGGEQQRIAMARAVVGRPRLLLADEPTGNLDEAQAARVMMLITALNRMGTTIVVATHNLGLLKRYPAPRLEIEHGRLVHAA